MMIMLRYETSDEFRQVVAIFCGLFFLEKKKTKFNNCKIS